MGWFEKGGVFLWPLLAMSVAALYFIIERTIYFAVVLPKYRKKLMQTCESDKVKTGEDIQSENDPLIKELLLAKKERSLNLDGIAIASEEHMRGPQHGINGLNIIAQTAPLVGLLGTITGIIRAFERIQHLQGQVNPSDLAGGIWEALINTAAGLIVAIPCVIAYLHFTRQVSKHETWIARAVNHVEKVFRKMGWEVI